MLEGLYYLITGGTSGIGAATAECIIKNGGSVICCYKSNTERATEFAQTMKEKHGSESDVILFKGDLCEEDVVNELVEFVTSTVSGESVLGGFIHSAGFAPENIFENHLDGGSEILKLMDEYNRLYPRALVTITEGILGLMPEGRGRIIMISTPGCNLVSPQRSFYELLGQAKSAAESLIRSYALRLAPKRITANIVIPGITKTDEWWMSDEELEEYAKRRCPMKVLLQPEAIAGVIVFLLSGAAAFTTGARIPVDGGLCLI